MKKKIITIFLLLIVISLSLTFANSKNEDPKNINLDVKNTNFSIKKDSLVKKDTVTIVAVGDMMLGTNYPSNPNYLPPNNDCSPLLKDVKKYLINADLTFGNCEGTFSDNPKYAKSCSNPRWCYRFSMPTKFVNCFVDAGFDVVSIANNHIHDLSSYGKKSTIKTLRDAGLHFAGVCEVPIDTFTINNVKYGFCAFAPNKGTCQITDYNTMQKRIKKLKKECQVVLVSFHGGAEGSKHEHVTRQTEYFLGQNRGNVYKFAHLAIDAGADLVIGQGPHVTRAIEIYKNKFIAYSLGNFCTYRRFNLRGISGIAPILKLWLNDKGDFIKGKIIPIYQDKFKGTFYDNQKRVIKRMQVLTKQDFPKGKLKITDEGLILLNAN